MKTGKAIVNPEARYTDVPVLITPSPAGGHNWQPMAFSPLTGLAYFPVTQNHFGYSRDPKFVQEPGKTGQLGIGTTGYDLTRKAITEYAAAHDAAWLTAWDPVAQKERWRAPYPRRGSGGILVTAGNLVFQGTINTTFAAYKADTGEKVWEMPVHQVPMAAPISYVVDGEQYIAVNAGFGGGTAAATAATFFKEKLQTPRLLVFKLNGKASLPAVAAGNGLEPPPPLTGTPEQIAEGETLFADNCSGCHGPRVSGGLKDLRVSSRQTHAEFFDIVLGGKRAEKGMASFEGILNRNQAEAIHAYIIKRANEDWPSIKAATGTK
jgi:quinohemoprotein ethanol dehydrogenase